jgi:hypothetical protein
VPDYVIDNPDLASPNHHPAGLTTPPMAAKKPHPEKPDKPDSEEETALADKARCEELSARFKDEARAAVIERDPAAGS